MTPTLVPDPAPLPEKLLADCSCCGRAGLWWPRYGVVTHDKATCRVRLSPGTVQERRAAA